MSDPSNTTNKLSRYVVRPAVSSGSGFKVVTVLADSADSAIREVKNLHRKMYGISEVSLYIAKEQEND